jgi:predicted PurR-regulated permease PerM
MTDNVLKPLMLGRGVDAPMPVILLGALGGMAAAGILGMFVGATLLALGYQIFMRWVAPRAEAEAVRLEARHNRRDPDVRGISLGVDGAPTDAPRTG